MVTVSAPGKIHLMGEHAVVYGKPALLAAINKRLCVRVEKPARDGIEIISPEPKEYIEHILRVVAREYTITELPSMKITITSDIPSGYHLGSSAAVAVATIGALVYFIKKIWNPMTINKLAYEAEKKPHGNPSGGDNTVVTVGGIVWYRKELEFLKSIWQLPFKPHPRLDHFYLINTGKPQETTGEMVEIVRSKVKRQKAKMERLFSLNEIQVKRIAVALKEGNESELINAIRVGERTLESMGVVSGKVSSIIRIIELNGGAAKILGGGGKKGAVGYVLAYHSHQKHMEKIGDAFHVPIEPIHLGEEGVRLEEKGQ